MLIRRTRRSTRAGGSSGSGSVFGRGSSIVPHADSEEIDEGGDDAESREHTGQPWPRVKDLVQTIAGSEAEPDGDGKHESERRRFEELLVLRSFIVRHERSAARGRRYSSPNGLPG